MNLSVQRVEQIVCEVIAKWELDRSKNTRTQILVTYSKVYGFPQIGA